MGSARERSGYAQAESFDRQATAPEGGTVAKPKFTTEKIRLGNDDENRSFNWQSCIKDHPYLTIGLAAGAGIMLIGLLKPRHSAKTHKKQLIRTLSNNVAGASQQLERGLDGLVAKPARVSTSVKAAAATMAAKALKGYLKRRLINALTLSRKRRLFS